MKNESPSRTESPDEIVEHIHRLMREAEALMVGPVASRAGDKIAQLRERFADLQTKAASTYAGARRKVADGARATDETIRSHPYESVAIALGIGVLVGAVLARSTR